MIRPATIDDAKQIASRIVAVMADNSWLVSEQRGSIVGYAYATEFDDRAAYRYSVETTVYLANDQVGRGLGSELYSALIEDLRSRSCHCAVGRIALPNKASVALHEKLGFANVAQLREIGHKFDQWIDVSYWQLIL
jgi:phosphinothricin acetyltransferase